MAKAVGIDLGTTNSVVATVSDGQPWVIPDENGVDILPSCVGIGADGKLLIGQDGIRQYAAAPERTVKSIKRQMGTSHKTTLGDRDYLPQEISAIILRSLKQRAETALGEEVTQAVITVPAFFTDAQRQATKEAGEIAGFEVLQVLNEPTAAALTYDFRNEATETVLVYDLGGGTFDVSIVEITGDVTEIIAWAVMTSIAVYNSIWPSCFGKSIAWRCQMMRRSKLAYSAPPSKPRSNSANMLLPRCASLFWSAKIKKRST
jgi:molecular chaperone DnaK